MTPSPAGLRIVRHGFGAPPRRPRSAVRVALGLALLLGSAGSFAVAAQAAPAPVLSPAPGAAQGADGLTLFGALMPVLTNPRCFNCHGGTNPATGENHGGGAVGASAVCL